MPRSVLVPSLALFALAVLAPLPARADGEPEVRRTRIVAAVERARPAVVAIHTTEIVQRHPWTYGADLSEFFGDLGPLPPISREGLGSGVVFHGDGYVVTNAHVILRANKILVDVARKDPATGEERTVQVAGRVLAVDVPNDLALLKLETTNGPSFAGPFPHLPLGRSNDLMLGEEVIAVGHPYGLGFTVTTGVLSGTGRRLPERSRAKKDDVRDFLQIDAAINQGNSGGPLMDVTGRWIGVTSAILNRRDTGAEGIGFAIPSDRVRALILRAMKRRLLTDEWIGIEEEEGKNGEAVVRVVYPKGPAAGANLKPGDVITSLNGNAVRSLYQYRMAFASLPVRGRVTLGVVRGGGALPEPVSLPLEMVPTDGLSRKHLGIEVVSVDEEINRETQIPFDSGVIIREVTPDGPGARIQLKPGDVIVGLGTWKIRNADDLLIFLQYVQPGDLVKVLIRRVVQRLADDRLRWDDKEGVLIAR